MIRHKALFEAGFDAGYAEGWDAAVDAFTTILDNDILHGAPGSVESKIVARRNLQTLRKRNPGVMVSPDDLRKCWNPDGTLIPVERPVEEPAGPPPPQPVPYVSEPGGPEWEAKRRERLAAAEAELAQRHTVIDEVTEVSDDDALEPARWVDGKAGILSSTST